MALTQLYSYSSNLASSFWVPRADRLSRFSPCSRPVVDTVMSEALLISTQSTFQRARRFEGIYPLHLHGRIGLMLISCLAHSSIDKLDAIYFPETSGCLRTTQIAASIMTFHDWSKQPANRSFRLHLDSCLFHLLDIRAWRWKQYFPRIILKHVTLYSVILQNLHNYPTKWPTSKSVPVSCRECP
jgi:hypothetical protein